MEDDDDKECLVEGIAGDDEGDADEDAVEEDAGLHHHDGELGVGVGGREGIAVVVAQGGEVGLRRMRFGGTVAMALFGYSCLVL